MILTMLADEKQLAVAVRVRPEPAFRAIVTGAVLAATGQVPEGDGHVFAGEPLPVGPVRRVPHEAQPVLTAGIVPAVTPPELPAHESLKGGIRLVDEGSSASLAELTGFVEVERLVVVEQVALAVVGGAAPGLLIPELRAALDGQSLSTKKRKKTK